MSKYYTSDIEKRKLRVSGKFDGAAPRYDRVGPRSFSYFGRRLVEIAQIPSACMQGDETGCLIPVSINTR